MDEEEDEEYGDKESESNPTVSHDDNQPGADESKEPENTVPR